MKKQPAVKRRSRSYRLPEDLLAALDRYIKAQDVPPKETQVVAAAIKKFIGWTRDGKPEGPK